MGLALHNTASPLDLLSQGPSQVTPSHISRRRTHYKGAFLRSDGTAALAREHADQNLPLLDLVLAANHQRRAQRRRTHRRPGPRSAQQWRADEAAEGLALATQNTPQLRRTPSLERQGAFRAPRTAKDRSHPGQDDAELYRLGLLYDDEHLRGSGFAMDKVACRGEEYSVRPAKRRRRAEQRYEDELQLALDLSLAELGRDESFARYLLSPDLDEAPSDDDEPDTSPRLEPFHFVSGIPGDQAPFSVDLPDLTSDSDLSLSSCSDEECWTATRPAHRSSGRRRGGAAAAAGSDDEDGDDAWMALGDGS